MDTQAGFRVYARTDREHKELPQNSSALRRSLIACVGLMIAQVTK